MIKRFDKNVGQFYMNELEIALSFIMSEYLHYLSMFKAYNVEHDVIDFRKAIYVTLFTIICVFVLSLFSITSIAIVSRIMGFL